MTTPRALVTVVSAVLLVSGCATSKSLVVLTLPKDVDVTALDAPVQIYDHYWTVEGGLQHRYLGGVANRDLDRVRSRTASLEIADPAGPSGFYYWFHAGRDPNVESFAAKVGGKVVYRRSPRVVLVRTSVPLSSVNWPYAIEVVPVDLRPIPPFRISRRHYDRTFQQHMMPLPDHVTRIDAVGDILDGLDFGPCELLLKQLTGQEPIQLTGSPYTVSTRHLCGPDIDPLIDWLANELTAAGLSVTIDFLNYTDGGCTNRRHRQIIATIKGTDLASQLFVVTAHLDAVPSTEGADDNASGAVALVCAAKALAKQTFRRTIQFVAFNAEEVGLRGSKDYVDDTFGAGAFEICGAFNMDMVAWDGDSDRKFQVQSNPGDTGSEFMRDRLVETVGIYGLNLVPVAVCDPDDTSDHGAFWQQGKPAVLAGEEYFCETPLGSCNWEPFCLQEDFNPNWHQPSDVFGTIQLDILRETTKAIIGVTAYAGEIQ